MVRFAARRTRRAARAAVRNGRPAARRARRFRFLKKVNNKGFLTICRKTKQCGVYAANVQGTVAVATGAGMVTDWITLGSPESVNGANYNVPFTMLFTMSDIINYTDLTNLADQYKINWVKVNIIYNSNVADVNGPASIPGIYYITDQDDAGVTSVSQTRERMGLRYKGWGSNRTNVSFVVKPKVAPLIYNGGTSGYSIPLTTTWLNCLTPSVPHYGVRGYFSNMYLPGAKDQASLFTFDITYCISAKDFE